MQMKMTIRSSYFALRRGCRRMIQDSNYLGPIFIVGAQKAGTTALHTYLESHPGILSGDEKELAFFNREVMYKRGLGYFRSYFPAQANGRYLMDSTPGYLYYKYCPQRIYDAFPNSKIVILLREPVARSFSGFNMYQQEFYDESFRARITTENREWREFMTNAFRSNEKLDISTFIKKEMEIIESGEECEEPSLIRRSIYSPQIERYIQRFGNDNVLVIFSEDLKQNTAETVRRVLDFIGLEPLTNRSYPSVHERSYTADSSGKILIKQQAGVLFEKDKQELMEKFGISVPW